MAISQDIQFRRLIHLRANLDKYEDASVNKMLAIFDKAVIELKASLKKPQGIDTKRQQKKLLKDIKKIHSLVSKAISKEVSKGVSNLGVKSLNGMEDIYSWDGKDPKYNYISEKAIKIADAVENVPVGGLLLADWVDKTLDETITLQRKVLTSRIKGESYKKMYKSLVGVYSDMTRKELITLTRTYNQSIAVAAQEKTFEENKDVIKSWRWTSILELGFSSSGRGTCPRCAALDGVEYKEGESRPPCPLHPRCRCMWSPITKTWDELFEERRLVDKNGDPLTQKEMRDDYRKWTNREESNINLGRGAGNVNSYEWGGRDYGEYITGKGGQSLINAVGPNRAKLIESGKLKFSDLVNKETGELYTLAQLGFPLGV